MIDPHENIQDVDDNIDKIPLIASEDSDTFYSNIIDIGDDVNENADIESMENVDELDVLAVNDQLSESIDDAAENAELSNSNNNDEYESLPLPDHRRCLSHLLNLLGNDFENLLTGRPKDYLIMAMNKLQALWMFPRKSAHSKTICNEILGCSLKIPCVTRWNSRFDAVSKIYELGADKINKYVDALKSNLSSAAHLSKLDKEDQYIHQSDETNRNYSRLTTRRS